MKVRVKASEVRPGDYVDMEEFMLDYLGKPWNEVEEVFSVSFVESVEKLKDGGVLLVTDLRTYKVPANFELEVGREEEQ